MDLIEVDVVAVQAPQTQLDLRQNVLAGSPMHIGTLAPIGDDLGRKQHLAPLGMQRLPDKRLRLAIPVGVRGLNKIDPFLHRLV